VTDSLIPFPADQSVRLPVSLYATTLGFKAVGVPFGRSNWAISPVKQVNLLFIHVYFL
jgi:hypothetical protein